MVRQLILYFPISVSALTGDGVVDLRSYLVNSAYPSAWDYPDALYTDEDPRETVKQVCTYFFNADNCIKNIFKLLYFLSVSNTENANFKVCIFIFTP
jgi:hypothetical protein